MFLRYAYVCFIGILLALFVAVGIAAFYQSPKQPIYSTPLGYPQTKEAATLSAQLMAEQQQKMQEVESTFQKQTQEYNRNVSIIALTASLLILIASLTFLKKFLFLTDGILLGGVLTLLYSIVRGFSSPDTKFRFLVVSVGLAVSLVLGYMQLRAYTKKKYL